MRLLPTLALTACTKVTSNLPDTTAERCAPQIQQVIDACEGAKSVIGTNDNKELYSAVDAAKQCLGERVRIICHDTGFNRSVSVQQFHQF